MDNTALQRQNKRLARLKNQGITRSTILVHEDSKSTLEDIRPLLLSPSQSKVLSQILQELDAKKSPTNVSQVKQLSPFRYPGGKTWLVPEVRKWLQSSSSKPSVFVEPFAGGAMAGLTCAAEALADHVFLSEIDEDVAAVWSVIFGGTEEDINWLCDHITEFKVTLKNVREVLDGNPRINKTKAFRTIVKNRMQRGGIMAAGAGLVKAGEAGKGLLSRWYPETLAARLKTLFAIRDRVTFEKEDAFLAIKRYKDDPKAFFFIDPPYTAGGKRAGQRLYTHNEINHEELFKLMSEVRGGVMMTYDDVEEVKALAKKYGFRVEKIPMKNTHHEIIYELLIRKP